MQFEDSSHMTSWPDHGVPDYATPLLQLRKKSWNDGQHSILVHRCAGVGRTGTLIFNKQANNEGLIDIPGIVTRLR